MSACTEPHFRKLPAQVAGEGDGSNDAFREAVRARATKDRGTLLTQAAADLGPAPVVDVVPSDPDDPRGAGFATAFLPLALTAVLAGALMFLLVPGRTARIAGLLTFSALAGLAAATVEQYWLGVLPGDYSSVAAAIGLLTLAGAATITGLGALLGRGVVLGVVLVFLVGNALSAVAAAPELLPQP